jgi:hypothetical protein
VRWFRGLSDRQTSQSQPIIGTPMLVPVPSRVIQAVGEGSIMDANSALAHSKPAPENLGEMGKATSQSIEPPPRKGIRRVQKGERGASATL